MKDELKEVLAQINNVDSMNEKEKSTLIACRSIAWSKYHRLGAGEAEKFIRKAIEENPKCDLWYFILGKNLRRKRRDSAFASSPCKEEADSFLKAYEMSENPVYGIFLAQMYREERKESKAIAMYEKVFRTNPTSCTILLRLALGFIRMGTYDRAQICLDKVAAKYPTSSMYLHYRGIFHLKQRQYKVSYNVINWLVNADDSSNIFMQNY